jgi:membrane-associated phospholipid phosphatase
MNEQVFWWLFNALGPDSAIPVATHFVAVWFPWLVIAGFVVYEFFERDAGGIRRSLLRVFLPPLAVLFAVWAFKFIYPTPRPFVTLDITPLFYTFNHFSSLPSSHTAFYTALSVSAYFCRRRLGVLAIIAALAIGMARIASGVHWPIDILAGLLVGIIGGLIADRALAFIWRKDEPKC